LEVVSSEVEYEDAIGFGLKEEAAIQTLFF